jgi:hypothetical protein
LEREHVVTVLDWFLLEGGEPCYETPEPEDDEVVLMDGIYEIRFDEFEVYVGPSTKPFDGVMDVAALVRPAMAFDPSFVISLIEPITSTLPDGFSLEVQPTDDGRNDSSVWLVVRLPASAFEVDYASRLRDFMDSARRVHRVLLG